MSKLCWLLLVPLLAPLGRAALPTSVDEFRQRQEREADTPDGALNLWFEAVFVYQSPDADRREIGADCLDLICADQRWRKNDLFLAQLTQKPYIFRSYCVGAEPDNDYAMDPNDFTLRLGKRTFKEDDQVCYLEVVSSGADKPRPAKLVRRDERWFVAEFGNLYAGVKAPRR